jgi:hypothetical protein
VFEFRLLSDATVGKGRTPRFQQVEGFILLGGVVMESIG